MKITPRKYAQALALMLGSAEKAIIMNFLQVLKQRRQIKMLPKIMKMFDYEWRKQRGITDVEVAYPPQFPSSLENVHRALTEVFGDKLHITTKPTEKLIGGFQVKIGDTLIDASVAGRLEKLAKRITTH